ncbi:MAG: hypothetical protein ACRDQ7_01570 [Haloechinothrix sp.]
MVAGLISATLLGGWGAVAGLLVGDAAGLFIGAAAGLLLGAVYGWAIVAGKAYDFTSPGGVLAFVVDHTWSVANTVAGAIFLTLNLIFGNSLDKTFTPNRNLVGLHKGVVPGFATTIGTVQAGTGINIDVHEAVHVLQARIFGPLYIPLVLANYVLATVLPYWLIYHDRGARPIIGLVTYFRRGVYPHTWNEEWAYRVQGKPPL